MSAPERLALGAVSGFSLGILFHAQAGLGWPAVGYTILIAGATAVLYAAKRTPLYLLAALFFAGAALGIARTELAPSKLPESFRPLVGTETAIEGVVVADPDIRETTQRITLEIVTPCQDNILTCEERTRVLAVAPLYPAVRYGERVKAEGKLMEPEPFATDGGRTFAYDAFLAKDGVFAMMQRASLTVVGPREGWGSEVRGALSDFKYAGLDALSAALPEPEASLAGGLILGGKQGLGASLLDDFITTGLVHIVVLSGYNVMIVADFVMRAFGFLSKGAAPALGAISIAVFVLAAGAGAASIRAGIMAAIAVYGRASGRTYEAFRALIFAGVLMLLWNPLTLPYDPGFQLSFVATLGLIFGAPITERWLLFVKSAFLREILASTIAAQIAVLPLLLYQNGLFSLVALPANALVLPIVPLTMLLSAVAGIAGFVVPAVAPALGFPAYLLLAYITGIVEFAARLPLAAFSVPAFPFALVVAAYIALGFLAARFSKHESRS